MRLLIAGLGQIGARHAAHAASMEGIELVGVIDPDQSLAQPGWGQWFPDLEAVDLAADGLLVATPNPLHPGLAEAAMERGLHVLVEKPLANTLEECDRIVAAAERTGKQVLVGHHRRHHATVAAMKAMLEGGAIGQTVSATLLWAMRKPDGYFDVPWRQGADGNPVRMNLIHEVDLLHHFLGQVVEIAALGAAPVRDEGRIESGGAVLRFKSGAVATLAFADTTPSPWGFEAATGESPAIAKTAQDYLHVAGTEGAIGFPSLTLWRGAKDWSEAPLAEHRSVPANVPLVAQLEHFADVCRGATPRVSAADGRAAVDVILRIEDAIGTVGPRRLSVKEEV